MFDLGRIPETCLPCGHVIDRCYECRQIEFRVREWQDFCGRWERPGVEFAVNGGRVLHTPGCSCVLGPARMSVDDFDGRGNHSGGSAPLTRPEAEAWLRGDHERRRCKMCAPDVQLPRWAKVGRRWVLAEDATR